jgi:hypothetical protein
VIENGNADGKNKGSLEQEKMGKFIDGKNRRLG